MAFRRKRGDTKVGTIERTYNIDLGVRADAKLSTVLKKFGAASVTELVRLVRAGQVQPWQNAERRTCRNLNLEHVGGPGAPDCTDGESIVVDVKHQERDVSLSQLADISRKPWARGKKLLVVATNGGFTEEATEFAVERGIELKWG